MYLEASESFQRAAVLETLLNPLTTWFVVWSVGLLTKNCHRRSWFTDTGLDSWNSKNIIQYLATVPLPSPSFLPALHKSFQEPVLILPDQLLHYLAVVPQIARPLKQFDDDRRKKLLQLAQLVMSTEPTESSQRTVRYLLSLVQSNPVPEPVPPLGWISTKRPGEFDGLINLDLGAPTVGRVIPQMQFTVRIRRL